MTLDVRYFARTVVDSIAEHLRGLYALQLRVDLVFLRRATAVTFPLGSAGLGRLGLGRFLLAVVVFFEELTGWESSICTDPSLLVLGPLESFAIKLICLSPSVMMD